MGLNPNLAVLMSGVATILFLLIVGGKIPSYLGTSASFVAAVAAIRVQGGNSKEVTGSILIAGLVLLAVGVIVHYLGGEIVQKVLPPAVTGAVVMLIGFNLAPVVARLLAAGPVGRPADHGVRHRGGGALSRVLVANRDLLGLIFGYVISWLFDHIFGKINSVLGGATTATEH